MPRVRKTSGAVIAVIWKIALYIRLSKEDWRDDGRADARRGAKNETAQDTADISRDASFETIKLDIRKIAAADRFMSRELDRNYTVPAGNYIFSAGDNSVNLNWRGGKVQDFVTSLNRRSNNTVRAAVIGISGNSQALLVESLQQGADKQLTFGGAALDLALDAGLIEQGGDEGTQFGLDPSEVKAVPGADMRGTAVSQGSITAPPRSAFQLMLPEQARSGEAALVC